MPLHLGAIVSSRASPVGVVVLRLAGCALKLPVPCATNLVTPRIVMMLRLASRSHQRALADCQWPQESEADQAARIRAGDERVFATLFLTHYASLCEFVDSYLHAPDVAEEVVQSVFLRIWESRHSWDPKGSARALLFTSCRNHALDLLRHEQIVRQAAEKRELGLGSWSVPRMADADLEDAELRDRLKAVVAGLPERRRLVVVLRWQYQLSNPEIARILGISVKGVEMQFSRALVDLRRQLGHLARDLV